MFDNSIKYYDFLTEKDKNIVDEMCPFKIGEKILVKEFINYLHYHNYNKYKGEVIDIYFEEWNKISILQDSTSYFIGTEIDEKIIEDFNNRFPRFRIFYHYDEKQPRSKWWKLWEKRTYKVKNETIVINRFGMGINESAGVHTYIEKME